MPDQELLEIVKLLEWSGKRWNAGGAAMHRQHIDGDWHPACPLCGGVKPDGPWCGAWMKEAIGHRPDCRIAAALAAGEGGRG